MQVYELAVISSLESIHSMLLQQGIDKANRYRLMKGMATEQLENLKKLDIVKSLKRSDDTTYLGDDEKKD